MHFCSPVSERCFAYGRDVSVAVVLDHVGGFFLCNEIAYAASDENVVVFALLCPEAAVGLALEYVKLVASQLVVLDVAVVAQCIYHCVDKSRLGVAVHVETPTGGCRRIYFVAYRLSCIKVVVLPGNGVENVGRASVVARCLECVALYNQQCLVVEGGYLCRLPCQQVVVDVSTPLRHKFHDVVAEQSATVEYGNNRVVGFARASAYIYRYDVSVAYLDVVLRHLPYVQESVLLGNKFYVRQSLSPGKLLACNVACGDGCVAVLS